MKRILFMLIFITSITFSYAQATRTWVSGTGDDVNPASRTAPCKTFAGAISKTAAGGEINVLDAGGYGSVTISKSITIDGGESFASILSSGTTGIIINAGPEGVVIIRHLSINGAGTGITGIKITSAKKIIIENCIINNFTKKGIELSNTGPCTVILSNVTLQNAEDAIAVNNENSRVVAENCRFQSCSNTGINLSAGKMTINGSNISDCSAGIMSAANTAVFISNNVISNNETAIQSKGTITSAGNNIIAGNKSAGTALTVIKLQ